MPLYRLHPDHLAPVPAITFAAARLTERDDLQRLLRDQIDVLDPDLLVIAEEFADWEDSLRRIDLLAVDRQANLVVVELKITEDGGHADLQALRYAAMVSAMTFEQAADAFGRYLVTRGRTDDARERLLAHLGWSAPDDGRFASDVRLVLVGPGFSRELTTTVLWLRDRGLDVRCVRVRPHQVIQELGPALLLADVEQVIPLREAEEFQVRLSRKAQEERAVERERPSVEQMRARIEEGCTPAERRSLDVIVRQLEAIGGRWFANQASLACCVRGADGAKHYPLSFRRERSGPVLEVWFRWLAGKPPFADRAVREAFRERLTTAPGIVIDASRVDGMPKVPLAALTDEASLVALGDAWRWFAEMVGGDAQAMPR